MPTPEQLRQSYYQGRNAAFNGEPPMVAEFDPLCLAFRQGYRDAEAEMRLDADTEWDSDD